MASFYEVLNPDGTTELIPATAEPLSMSEARSLWQFEPNDTVIQALNKWSSAALQGIPFGDELAAGLDALGGVGTGGLGNSTPISERYAQRVGAYRGAADQAYEQSPTKSILAGVVAGLPIDFAVPATLPSALGLGALYGAGAGDGDLADRAKGAGLGALLGGTGYGIGKKVLEPGIEALATTRPGRVIIDAAQSLGSSPGQRAGEMGAVRVGGGAPIDDLSRAERGATFGLYQRGFDVDSALAAQRQAIADGQDVQTLLEAGYLPQANEGVLNFGDALAQDPAGAAIAGRALRGRVGEEVGTDELQRARVESFLDAISPERDLNKGGARGYAAIEDMRSAGRRELSKQAKPLYEGMFDDPVQGLTNTPIYDPTLVNLMSEPDAAAILKQFNPINSPNMDLAPGSQQAAKAVASELKALQREGKYAGLTDAQIARSGRVGQAIDARLAELNPGYREADRAYAELMPKARQLENYQYDIVKDILRGDPSQVGQKLIGDSFVTPESVGAIVSATRNLSGPERVNDIAAAVRGELTRKMGDKGGADYLNTALGRGTAKGSKLEAIIGPEKTETLSRQLTREKNMQAVANKILNNSRTGVRAVEADSVASLTKMVIDAVKGSPAAFGKLLSKANPFGLSNQAKKEMAEFVFSSGGDAAKNIERMKPYIEYLLKTDKGAELLASIVGKTPMVAPARVYRGE